MALGGKRSGSSSDAFGSRQAALSAALSKVDEVVVLEAIKTSRHDASPPAFVSSSCLLTDLATAFFGSQE
uniref:Uncharacterized protein n=1 Tax=Glossina brevipalpis TaxID=37001 RepID=A0A1A9WQ58_9MUSC